MAWMANLLIVALGFVARAVASVRTDQYTGCSVGTSQQTGRGAVAFATATSTTNAPKSHRIQMKAPLQGSAVFGLVAAPPPLVVNTANASRLTGLTHDRRRIWRALLVAAFFGVALIGAAVTFLVPASHAVDQPNPSKRATKKRDDDTLMTSVWRRLLRGHELRSQLISH